LLIGLCLCNQQSEIVRQLPGCEPLHRLNHGLKLFIGASLSTPS
jgi:hypothetical protein